MLNAVYQLVRPRQFEVSFSHIDLNGGDVIVRPTHLSICNADQRYYQGKRSEEILRQKLPMALIHEAIGRVVADPTGTFAPGDKVVMIPNVPVLPEDPAECPQVVAENYRRSSKFRGSSLDGFMQEYIATRPDRLVKIPDCIDNDLVAAFTEMVSVCYHAISRFERTAHAVRGTIGVWGDGNMGYFTALLLHARFPEAKILVFGVDESKLSDFTFADAVYKVNAIPKDLIVDHAFECVGGMVSGTVIGQIIDHIRPEGTIAILGVSEEPVPIYTRMVLEKGLRIIGTSRSGYEDFAGVIELYAQRPDVVNYLEKMVGAVVDIRSIRDINEAFEMDIAKAGGKTIMHWECF
ncbi:MAG: alcohol dehydrogenase catalytic domain-containing protein [Lachnospiraceae bacterium]|nr:alcohol dehydrogenase catalytic domain-containing protein [Lachnospiraceae bacterium]